MGNCTSIQKYIIIVKNVSNMAVKDYLTQEFKHIFIIFLYPRPSLLKDCTKQKNNLNRIYEALLLCVWSDKDDDLN